jgi:hypothetical protein
MTIKPNIFKQNTFIFFAGLIIFAAFNLFTASTLGLHYDEAYYWLYSKSPALGYFDHPPMIAWLIYAGTSITDSELGVRLFVVLLSTLSVFNLWILTKPYNNKPLLFWALIFSVLIIHPFSFIASPDAPIFFFTTCFFVLYKQYLLKTGTKKIIVLALLTALMFYSKYQAVLIPFFIVLSDIKQIRTKQFWLYAILAMVFILPHIFWQLENNFASFRYHLIDSHKDSFNPLLFLEYTLSQLLIAGPWLGWLFIYITFAKPVHTEFEKALKWCGAGILIFFFLTTFGGDFEAHWTLIAFVPIIILAYKYIAKRQSYHKWLYVSAGINLAILLSIRILAITPIACSLPVLKTFYGWETDAKMIKVETGNYPVIFQDAWNKAARFAWFTRDPSVSNLNSAKYRQNQFDIWKAHKKHEGKTVYIVTTDSLQFSSSKRIETPKQTWFIKQFENFKTFYELSFEVVHQKTEKQNIDFIVNIKNNYSETIDFTNCNTLFFELHKRSSGNWDLVDKTIIDGFLLKAHQTKEIEFSLKLKNENTENIYLTMRVGELKPIPVKYSIK